MDGSTVTGKAGKGVLVSPSITVTRLWQPACNNSGMILLVTGIERREQCAEALARSLAEPVVTAKSLLDATAQLRAGTYTAVVFDDELTQSEPNEIEMTLAHMGTAIPLEVNLAISGTDRLVRGVRAALRRRRYEEASAHEAAARSLRGELSGTLTTLLLECELALESRGLPAAATERLMSLHSSLQNLRMQLERATGYA